MDFKESKTYKNLEKAFEGEAKAHLKYQFYKSKIANTSKELENLLDEIIHNEKEHGKIWFKLLHNGEVPTDEENLQDAITGELMEYKEMYPNFAKIAYEETASLRYRTRIILRDGPYKTAFLRGLAINSFDYFDKQYIFEADKIVGKFEIKDEEDTDKKEKKNIEDKLNSISNDFDKQIDDMLSDKVDISDATGEETSKELEDNDSDEYITEDFEGETGVDEEVYEGEDEVIEEDDEILEEEEIGEEVVEEIEETDEEAEEVEEVTEEEEIEEFDELEEVDKAEEVEEFDELEEADEVDEAEEVDEVDEAEEAEEAEEVEEVSDIEEVEDNSDDEVEELDEVDEEIEDK